MWWIYLDESGDLGFDFVNKKPSKYFTVCLIVLTDRNKHILIRNGVRKTLARKLNKPRKSKTHEIKGINTSIEVKKYFFKLIANVPFGIYALTLNKRRVYEPLTRDKERIYNWIARMVIEKIPFEKATERIQIVLDKSKGKPEIAEFNRYIKTQIKGRINPEVPLNIDHLASIEDQVLQAVDLFNWGIFRKYERRDEEWYKVFRKKSGMINNISHKKRACQPGSSPEALAYRWKGTLRTPGKVLSLISRIPELWDHRQ